MGLRFFTLFNTVYASRGLALYLSLRRVLDCPFELTVLAMDAEVGDAIRRLDQPGLSVINLEDLSDPELLRLRGERPMREFCWTATPALMLAVARRAAPGEVVYYLDADLMFFSDPRPVLDEIEGRDILIHEHRYARGREEWAATSGRFNVGLTGFRHSTQGLACLERWRAQCIEKCVLDPENGYCGDQKYLDEWPGLYTGLQILEHAGGGVAPWNIEDADLTASPQGAMINGRPLVFYHFHAMRLLRPRPLGRLLLQPAAGYRFGREVLDLIYRPYAQTVKQACAMLRDVGMAGQGEVSLSPFRAASQWMRGELIAA